MNKISTFKYLDNDTGSPEEIKLAIITDPLLVASDSTVTGGTRTGARPSLQLNLMGTVGTGSRVSMQ